MGTNSYINKHIKRINKKGNEKLKKKFSNLEEEILHYKKKKCSYTITLLSG